MFERAAKTKIRFQTAMGKLQVEDLFDLPLSGNDNTVNLDSIACELFQQIKDEGTVSFVKKEKRANSELQLKFDIVKRVIEVRLAEAEAAEKAVELKQRKQQIMALISQKENEALAGSSIDDLRKMLDEIGQ